MITSPKTPEETAVAVGNDRMLSARGWLLWLDCGGGLAVGSLMLMLAGWLRPLYQLPTAFYFGVAVANLLYGCGSLTLALRRERSTRLIGALALANALWGGVCLVAVIAWWNRAAPFGLAHLAAEGAFVVWLACQEWRHRNVLAKPAAAVT